MKFCESLVQPRAIHYRLFVARENHFRSSKQFINFEDDNILFFNHKRMKWNGYSINLS
jgi:hypothetical protein